MKIENFKLEERVLFEAGAVVQAAEAAAADQANNDAAGAGETGAADGAESESAELESLAGVGKKTANVVYAVGFGGQAIAVDTHVFRVSNRLGITDAKNVNESQKQLEAKIPREMWSDAHHWILLFGRYVCKSQNPNCQDCYLKQYCKFIEKRS